MNIKTQWKMGFAGLALAGALLAGAQSQPAKAGAESPEKAVLARLGEIQAAAQGLDADKVFSMVLENDKGALVQNGKILPTRQAALEATRKGFRGLQSMEYQLTQQQVTMLSPAVALVVGEGTSSGTTSDGRTISTAFAQSVVLVQTNGQWQVLHAHRSFPPAK